jgi:prophage regulatory protein
MVRRVLRKADVLQCTGWKNSALYDNIAKGNFPKSTRLVPDGIAVWFEDEVSEWQQAAAAGKLDAWRAARVAEAV